PRGATTPGGRGRTRGVAPSCVRIVHRTCCTCGGRVPRTLRGTFSWHTRPETALFADPLDDSARGASARGTPASVRNLARCGPVWPLRVRTRLLWAGQESNLRPWD